ncbi:hypothetical protein [Streptomyces sp. NPDC012508]|uniref:hypothetical protein n=1 Tax=Streptomyces sp. NPDC012508 TaxID=3364837 RepID=UPI0036A94336
MVASADNLEDAVVATGTPSARRSGLSRPKPCSLRTMAGRINKKSDLGEVRTTDAVGQLGCGTPAVIGQ